jgi:glycine cleavage system H protein
MVFNNIMKRCFSSTIRFTKSHEYIKYDIGYYTLGITKFAADSLGDIVFVTLPKKGNIVVKEDAILDIDSIKAVSEIYTPISGKIININIELEDDPSLINISPLDKGWIVQIESEDNINDLNLMNNKEYEDYIKHC